MPASKWLACASSYSTFYALTTGTNFASTNQQDAEEAATTATSQNFSSFIDPCTLSEDDAASQFAALGIETPPKHCCNRGQWRWTKSSSFTNRTSEVGVSSSSRAAPRRWGPGGKVLSYSFDEEESGLCENLLFDYFAYSSPDMPAQSLPPTSIVFLGDSTMKALYEIIASQWKKGRNVTEVEASRCGMMEFLGLPPSSTGWTKPAEFLSSLGPVGPVRYGLSSPYCTDCYACYARSKVDLSPASPLAVSSLHLLPLEFALDVELQTDGASTTQEVYFKYLGGKYGAAGTTKPACVVNVGIHDMRLPLGASQFAENVGKLLGGLAEVCGRVVWVTISSTTNVEPQNVEKVKGWNDEVKKVIYRDLASQVATLDVEHMSSWNSMVHIKPLDLHSDNVHLLIYGSLYYDTIAYFFRSKILEA